MQQFDPTSASAIRVLVADSNASVRAGLRAFVEAEPGLTFIGDVEDAECLLWALQAVEVDLLVLDSSLAGEALPEIVEWVKLERPEARIVILGSGPWLALAALDAGADAYVSKCEPPDVLRAAMLPSEAPRNCSSIVSRRALRQASRSRPGDSQRRALYADRRDGPDRFRPFFEAA
jgi:DNA-binding NarL/FixJ family response regulator